MTSPPRGVPESRLFREIDFCSNSLVGVQIPIMVDETPMLALGYGKVPLVWLQAPADPKGERWDEVVRESTSLHPNVTVETDIAASAIRIKVLGHDVLHVITVSEVKARIPFVDFRGFGLPVVGSDSGLQIGGSTLVGNMFVGARVGFRLSLKGVPTRQRPDSQTPPEKQKQ